jgi:O-antigen/teichoic acid export membrane protein
MKMVKDFLPGIIRVFSNITPILIFFIFAQIISVEELGLINYFISVITIAGVFTDFGIPEAIQRFLPQVKDKAKLITYTIKLEIFVVFLGAFLFLIFDIITNQNLSKGYLLILLLTFLFSASNTIILIFNGLRNQRKLSEYFALSSMLFLLLTFVFYYIFELNPVTSFLLARLISWSIYTVIPIYELNKAKLLTKEVFEPKAHNRFNQFALNTFIYMGGLTLLTQWDSILITNVDGAYTNGIYKSVAFVATIPIVLVTILHTKLLPFFSQLSAEKKFDEIKIQLKNHTKYLTLILSFAFIIQFLIYKPILNIFLKEEIVQQTGDLFPLIFLAVCLHILASPYISALQAIGQEKIIRNLTIIQVSIFIISSTVFYPYYSYNILPILLIFINTGFLTTIILISNKKLFS